MKSSVSQVAWDLVAIAAVWSARPATVQARGCGGGGCPGPRPTAPDRLSAALSKCLGNEKIAVALKRFVCLKASVETNPDEEMREEVRKNTPLVFTYDPAGKQTAHPRSRRTRSRSTLAAGVEKAHKQPVTPPTRRTFSELGRNSLRSARFVPS